MFPSPFPVFEKRHCSLFLEEWFIKDLEVLQVLRRIIILSTFGKWKLNEIELENCCMHPSIPLLSFFKVTRANHRPSSSLFHIGYISVRTTDPGPFSITSLYTPPPHCLLHTTNQQRHSRVIGFYVMLSSRQLRMICFPSGWARDIPIKALRS